MTSRLRYAPEYDIQSVAPDRWTSPNRRQGLRFGYAAAAFSVEPRIADAGGWHATLRLQSVSVGDATLEPMAHPTFVHEGSSLVLRHPGFDVS